MYKKKMLEFIKAIGKKFISLNNSLPLRLKDSKLLKSDI
jgi:hypothetical protein